MYKPIPHFGEKKTHQKLSFYTRKYTVVIVKEVAYMCKCREILHLIIGRWNRFHVRIFEIKVYILDKWAIFEFYQILPKQWMVFLSKFQKCNYESEVIYAFKQLTKPSKTLMHFLMNLHRNTFLCPNICTHFLSFIIKRYFFYIYKGIPKEICEIPQILSLQTSLINTRAASNNLIKLIIIT